MFGIGMPELIIISFIILIIFGAGKLPKIMGDMGKGLRDFKAGVDYNPDEERRLPDDLEEKEKQV